MTESAIHPTNDNLELDTYTTTIPIEKDNMFVVGIGASAGGIEALKLLLPHLPASPHIAYVVAQHMAPQYRSMLASLLDRNTAMQVVEATNHVEVVPKTIYITPPGANISFEKGRLRLQAPHNKGKAKPSIDLLFDSLAKEKKEKTIGIVLSGTGSDGTRGMQAIKAEGGITIAQEETSAKYSGMPHSAIISGMVDIIVSPERMGEELIAILKHPAGTAYLPAVEEEENSSTDHLQTIFDILLERTDCDFSNYKHNTIHRRLQRRMAIQKIDTFEAYSHYLQRSDAEAHLLLKDILISVTGFFRDSEAFKALHEVLKEIIYSKKNKDNLRIWVPGCATGEEAYSIAILIADELRQSSKRLNIQIFATDLDTDAIAHARKGVYSEAVIADIDNEKLNRYFYQEGEYYHAKQFIREMIVFSRHDLIKDPPFSRLDLISCRNLLIYFNQSLQQELLSLFHYVLVPEGFLFLGKSESVTQLENHFSILDKKWKLFQKRDMPQEKAIVFSTIQKPTVALGKQKKGKTQQKNSLRDLMNQALVDLYDQPAVLVNSEQSIVHIQGDISPYLNFSDGDTSLDILSLITPQLRSDLRVMFYKFQREGLRTYSQQFSWQVNEKIKLNFLRLCRLDVPNHQQDLVLVLFEQLFIDSKEEIRTPNLGETENEIRILDLEQDLIATREHLHTTIEELETANEELQSLNEEMQSSNEELQATNEELETANEELQSTNEELTTVNEELQIKSVELTDINERLKEEIQERKQAEEQIRFQANLLNVVGQAVIATDLEGNITYWNGAAECIYGWKPSEVLGHNVVDIIPSQQSKAQAEAVLASLFAGKIWQGEFLVRHRDGYEFMVHVTDTPIYNEERELVGIIGVSMDVSRRIEVEKALKESNEELSATVLELKTTQDQMVQQERLAAVGQLAAGIAHDFNNILTSIALYNDLMMQADDISTKYASELKLIKQQVQAATKLTQQILDFGRKTIIQQKELDLVRFFRKYINDILQNILPENLNIVVECRVAKCIVMADPTRWQQVLLNLAINARDAMPDGGNLTVTLEQITVDPSESPMSDMNNGIWAKFAISDTGYGIEPDILNHIFEPFFTTRAPLGSGLGLAQVYGIVKQHHGHIEVTSNVGKGTTFTIYLPALNSDIQDEFREVDDIVVPATGTPHILIVEDDQAVQTVLKRTLEKLGYQVSTAKNGQEGLTFYQNYQDSIDLVVTDMMMPEMSGQKMAQHIQKIKQNLPILFISGYPLRIEELQEDVILDHTQIVQKPITIAKISQILIEMLA